MHAEIHEQMRKFSEAEVVPHAHEWHLKNDYIPMEIVQHVAELGRAVSVGDLNGDAFNDLAVANYTSSSISVLLNKGDGTFYPAVNYSAGGHAGDVVIVDLNLDGHNDMAATSWNMDWVAVYINKGDGTFEDMVTYGGVPGPEALSAADFDSDGDIDIVTVNSYLGNSLSVLYNKGDGTFALFGQQSLEGPPRSVFADDFDNDSLTDIVVACGSFVDLYRSESAVSDFIMFSRSRLFSSESGLAAAVFGDLDNNGFCDLFYAAYDSGQVSVFLNTGGVFDSLTSVTVGRNPGALCPADFDGDNRLDLAVLNESAGEINFLQNNGDSTLSPVPVTAAGDVASSLTAADFDDDGDIDLAVCVNYNGVVIVRNETGSLVEIDETEDTRLPGQYLLGRNYPNPFNPETLIEYQLPVRSRIKITVFDLLGREIAVLVDEIKPAGAYVTRWNGCDMENNRAASGIYFYQLNTGKYISSAKMILLK